MPPDAERVAPIQDLRPAAERLPGPALRMIDDDQDPSPRRAPASWYPWLLNTPCKRVQWTVRRLPARGSTPTAVTEGLLSRDAWRVAAQRTPLTQRRLAAKAAATLWRWLLLLDGIAAAAAVLLAHAISPVARVTALSAEALGTAVIYAVAFTITGFAGGLYDWRIGTRRRALLARLLVSALVAAGLTLGFYYLVFYQPLGRRILTGAVILSGPLMLIPRVVLSGLALIRKTRVVFVGRSSLTKRLMAAVGTQRVPLYEVVGQWPASVEGMADAADLVDLCRSNEADEIVVPARSADLNPVLAQALHCLPLGCRIRSDVDFYENLLSAIPVAHVTPGWLLSRGFDTANPLAEALKRVSDLALSLVLLVVTAPLFLLGIVVVWAGRDGPVFYAQTRVGRYGRPFRMIKLRTMRTDAEQDGPRWAEHGDSRRTRGGVLLRRTRIDELPQIVNILLGHMSLVGPRPERPEFVAELERCIPFYGWRHLVRPGLTGWAQINHRYGSSVQDARRKLEYDLFYVRHNSVLTDISIVLRTIEAGLRGSR